MTEPIFVPLFSKNSFQARELVICVPISDMHGSCCCKHANLSLPQLGDWERRPLRSHSCHSISLEFSLRMSSSRWSNDSPANCRRNPCQLFWSHKQSAFRDAKQCCIALSICSQRELQFCSSYATRLNRSSRDSAQHLLQQTVMIVSTIGFIFPLVAT